MDENTNAGNRAETTVPKTGPENEGGMKTDTGKTTRETGLAAPETGRVSIVEDLARQAQHYARGTAFNMLQLGRVLTEARALVPHGEWADWVDKNAELDLRAAQYFMQCYATYGVDPEMAKLGQSKLVSMLPMSEDEREKLMAAKDVGKMSVRELRDEIRKARAEEREKAEKAIAEAQEKARESLEAVQQGKVIELARQKENADRALADALKMAEQEKKQASRTLEDALEMARLEKAAAIREVTESKDSEIRTMTAHRDEQIEAQKAQIEAMKAEAETLRQRAEEAEASARAATEAAAEGARDISRQTSALESEARKLRAEVAEKNALIEEMQEQYDQIQQEYLNAQSAFAKGDAERANSDILSADAVSEAVRIFIGQVGRVPYMHGGFAAMDNAELNEYRANVLQVLEWAEKSLQAIETVNVKGVVE